MIASKSRDRRQSLDGDGVNRGQGNDISRLGHRSSETDSGTRRGSNSSVDSRFVFLPSV